MLANLAPERHPEPVTREERGSPPQPQSWPALVHWTSVCPTLGHGLHNTGGGRSVPRGGLPPGQVGRRRLLLVLRPPLLVPSPSPGQLCPWEGRVGGRWPGVSSGEWTEGPGRGGSQAAPGRRSLLSQPPASSQTSGPNPRVAKPSLPVWDERRQPALAAPGPSLSPPGGGGLGSGGGWGM